MKDHLKITIPGSQEYFFVLFIAYLIILIE